MKPFGGNRANLVQGLERRGEASLPRADLLLAHVAAGSVPSPSGSVPGAAAPFRPLFNDFGPPSMGYVQVSGAEGLPMDGDWEPLLGLSSLPCSLDIGNETTWRPGLPEHLHRPAVGHRGDGQRDPAHLCW